MKIFLQSKEILRVLPFAFVNEIYKYPLVDIPCKCNTKAKPNDLSPTSSQNIPTRKKQSIKLNIFQK